MRSRLGLYLPRILTSHGFSVTGLACLKQAAATLAFRRFDHAVLDLRLLDRNGLDLVRLFRKRHPHARIVIVTDADSFGEPGYASSNMLRSRWRRAVMGSYKGVEGD